MASPGGYQGDVRGEFVVALEPPRPATLSPLSTAVVGASVRMPGPVQVGASPQQSPTSDCRIIINNLIPSIQLMLGPLGFLFCILGVITKIIDCVNAVPKCIIQLSPVPILAALEGLLKAVVCLAKLLPQLSMLYMIYDILTLLVAFLECVISALTSIKAIQQELTDALAGAGNDQELKDQLISAQGQTATIASQTFTVTNPLVPIFLVLKLFLPLFGQQAPDFSVPAPGTPIDTVLPILVTLHDTLATIKVVLGEIIGV